MTSTLCVPDSCFVKPHVLNSFMHGVFPHQDTTWLESEPSSALPDMSSFNLRGLGLLDTGEAFIKCGYTPCPQTFTYSAHSNPPEGVKETIQHVHIRSIDIVKYFIYACFMQKNYLQCVCVSVCCNGGSYRLSINLLLCVLIILIWHTDITWPSDH